jgi:hypothetical protein
MEGNIVGKKLVLKAADHYGNEYSLPIQIVRANPCPSGMLLGCRFEIDSEEVYRQVIRFVYGDSNRLKYYYQKKSERPNSSFVGLFNLIGIGMRGTLRNVRGLTAVSIYNFKKFITPSIFRVKDKRRISVL